MKKLLLPIITLVLAVSCQVTELAPVIDMADDCLYGSMESMNATKTSMDEYNNILWSEGDQLVAFMKTTLGRKYQIKEEYVGSTTGSFSRVTAESSGDDLESGNELSHIVVLYPYASTSCMKNDGNETANSYKVNLNLPETQTYAVGSFGNGSFPMIAVSSSNELLFKNICGGIKLQFKGEDKIKSIKLESIGGEKISGKATVVGYADETAPATTMDETAVSSVTLDCGDGVQLSDEPTTFIISVPPVVFESGMKITVTDTDGFSRELTNASKNTVKRSTLLTFPVITYTQTGVFELAEGTLSSYEIKAEGGTIEIPVVTNQDYQINIPDDASWINVVKTKVIREEVITIVVSENEIPETRSAEILFTSIDDLLQAVIIKQDAAEIKVNQIDYIDEYGINHGKGTVIDGVVWAPVNCGYHETGFKYGKLYQWGRKYGQGYSGDYYDGDWDQKYLDAITPTISSRSASLSEGQDKKNSTIYYAPSGSNWCSSSYSDLWNEGDEYEPVKTSNDPCPAGWRVPTYTEMKSFTDKTTNIEISLPLAGRFTYYGYAADRGTVGYYWTSTASNNNKAYYLLKQNVSNLYDNGRIYGCSVRCVQDLSVTSPPIIPDEELVPEPGESMIVNKGDYFDEYKVNHGQGIEIDGIVWAPVNCGYHKDDFQYGKLYQWGRKYGQGYSGLFWDGDWNQSYSDSIIPELVQGPLKDVATGQLEANENKFYYNTNSYSDWISPYNDALWNRGTEQYPTKTNYDPCPEGWRVPSSSELNILGQNRSNVTTDTNGHSGYWYSGSKTYTENTDRVFLPCAGLNNYKGTSQSRGSSGGYWSSTPYRNSSFYAAYELSPGYSSTSASSRASGLSVRCVRE